MAGGADQFNFTVIIIRVDLILEYNLIRQTRREASMTQTNYSSDSSMKKKHHSRNSIRILYLNYNNPSHM